MALDNASDDYLVEHLGWYPTYIANSMITIRHHIPTTVPITPIISTIALFDTLPTEILHFIFNLLDFRSLSQFLRISHRAKVVVESLPAYRDVSRHAPEALVALSRTKLIAFHSAASIHAALLSDKCVVCREFGPFLFLPTVERCCYQCLHKDRSLRMVEMRTARKCFGLKPTHLRQIPSMLSIPGSYFVGNMVEHLKSVRLFSLKQAKELGVAVYGSQEAMERLAPPPVLGKDRHEIRWLCRPFSESPTRHPFGTPIPDANVPNDRFCGMASVNFPVLRRNNVIEIGIWCFGCRVKRENYSSPKDLDEDIQLLVARGVDPYKVLSVLERRARSKDEFIKHVKICKGAKEFFEKGRGPIQSYLWSS